MSSSWLSSCQEGDENNDTDAILQCFADRLEEEVNFNRQSTRQTSLVIAGALVFLMQAGFAMLCAGAVRKKNVQNTMLKNLLDACGASLAFFVVGYAFAFSGMDDHESTSKTVAGLENFLARGVEDFAFWFYQYAFAAAACTIVAGTLAERCQMAAYLCYSVVLTGVVYPIVAHAVWHPHGILSASGKDPFLDVGMIDFAGSGVVHVTGGVTALFATMILGPRRGRFHDDSGRRLDQPREFHGHSIALQMLGTFLLWCGWYGFNCGSAWLLDGHQAIQVAPLAAVNTTLAGGTAGIVALLGNMVYLERFTGEPFFDLKYAMNGSLCGLVGITAGCGIFDPWAAVVTGFVAGLLYIVGARGLVYMRLDDAVDAIPVHFLNGMWGVISVGLFARKKRLSDASFSSEHQGLVYDFGDGILLGAQIVGLLTIIAWVMVVMLPFFIWLDWKGWFRSDAMEEIVGLDQSYHGGLALRNGDEVQPEYIMASRDREQQKKNHLHRRSSEGGPVSETILTGSVNGDVSDDWPPDGGPDQDLYEGNDQNHGDYDQRLPTADNGEWDGMKHEDVVSHSKNDDVAPNWDGTKMFGGGGRARHNADDREVGSWSANGHGHGHGHGHIHGHNSM